MSGCLTDEEVLTFVAGRLPEEALPAFREHLHGCATCLALLRAIDDRPVMEPQASLPAARGAEPGAPPLLRSGDLVHRYQILSWLGAGSMGVVYAATDTQLQRKVAIKLLRSEAPDHTDEVRSRLLREARTMAQLSHENVAAVHDIGVFEDHLYIVMEFVKGASLQERLRQWQSEERGVNVDAVLAIARQIVSALCAAHQQQIVHRDLKPSNIMLTNEPDQGERVKVVDFGLAKRTTGPSMAASAEAHHEALRSQGMFIGTPLYASPEQYRAGPIDGKADVYSLGVMLYEMLAGQPPFLGGFVALLEQHHAAEPAPLNQVAPLVPAALCALVHEMLQKRPEQRPTMEQIRGRLVAMPGASAQRAPRGVTRSRPRRALAVVVIVLLASLGTLGALWDRPGWRRAPRVAPRPKPGVFIPGGTFLMGTPPEKIDAMVRWCQSLLSSLKLSSSYCRRDQFEREQPVRQIGVSPFYLDRTEVTNERFASWLSERSTRAGVAVEDGRVVREGTTLLVVLDPSLAHGGIAYAEGRFIVAPAYQRRPVTWVTWHAARAYCRDQGQRLPTEAEWEYAAGGSQGQRFPWGDDDPQCGGVVFARREGRTCAHALAASADVCSATQDRSLQGACDLAGNVAEWVEDAFTERYPGCPLPCTDPIGEGGASGQRVVRGGDWLLLAPFCRAAFRSRAPAGTTAANIGFRCAVAANQ